MKKKNFLLIYFIVIIIVLVCILFILPDSFFSKKYDDNYKKYFGESQNKEDIKVKPFTDYEEQKEMLINNTHKYKYVILDSMGTESYRYECLGEITTKGETGECTFPVVMKYTGENKKQAFDKINNDYITPEKIFSLLKNIEPTLESHNTYREYTYNIKIKELDTEIIVRTTKEEITQISINNAFMSYLLKYESTKVDN